MKFEWISVDAKIPGDTKNVLLFDKIVGECVGFYCLKTGRFKRFSDGYLLTDVTHWMHLPERPQQLQPKGFHPKPASEKAWH